MGRRDLHASNGSVYALNLLAFDVHAKISHNMAVRAYAGLGCGNLAPERPHVAIVLHGLTNADVVPNQRIGDSTLWRINHAELRVVCDFNRYLPTI
jgi:hypothetical protein